MTRPRWHRGVLGKQDIGDLENSLPQGGASDRIEPSSTLLARTGPSSRLGRAVQRDLPGAFPVRFVLFDKAERGWGLPWHQDRVIAVEDRIDQPGYSAWTRKGGVWHTEPPDGLLSRMLFVRVLLTDVADGGMAFAKGSDAEGRVPADQAEEAANRYPVEIEKGRAGDVLVLPALTLHKSTPASCRRRVLRVDYAAESLPEPLAWAA